ncbi:MAG: TraR/DksA family transcriptional regulator [Myxococcales bacterium]|nr:TraR/DksA family transcriptional regulator [Myxococcales bacterium]
MTSHDELRARLETRLQQLTHRVGKIEEDLRRTPHPDSEERATETQNDEVLGGLDASSLVELRQIQAALHRIEEGTYGACVGCGEKIADRRLEVVPYAATCVDCAK